MKRTDFYGNILPAAENGEGHERSDGGDGGGGMDDTNTRLARVEDGLAHVGDRLTRVETHVEHLRTDMSDVKSEIRGLRWWILGTGIGNAVAVICGIGAIVVMLDQLHTVWFHRHQEETVASLTRRIDDAERRFKEGGDEADRRWAERLKRELRTLEEFWRERDARSGGR